MNVNLVPMTDADFTRYIENDTRRYADANVQAGHWTAAEALEKSRQVHEQLLPDGAKTANHYFFTIQAVEPVENVGNLWLSIVTDSSRPYGFIYDLYIEEPYRRLGYASQAMLTLEEKAAELGAQWLGLQVFTFNQDAKALYEKIGYEISSFNMVKQLTTRQGDQANETPDS